MANASPPDGERKGGGSKGAEPKGAEPKGADPKGGAHGGGHAGERKARAPRRRNSLPRTEGVQTVPRAPRRAEATRGAALPGTARNQVGGLGPCVALVELASIAAGFETVDALRKEAAVEILRARP